MNNTTNESIGNTTIESVDDSFADLFGNIESIPLDPNESNILDDSIVFNTSSVHSNQGPGSLHLSDLNTSEPNQSQGSLHLSDLEVSEDSMRNNTTMESFGGKKHRKRKTKSKGKQSRMRKSRRKYKRKIKRITFKQSGKKHVRKLKTRKIR